MVNNGKLERAQVMSKLESCGTVQVTGDMLSKESRFRRKLISSSLNTCIIIVMKETTKKTQ